MDIHAPGNEMIESKDVMSQSKDLISNLPRDIVVTILERLPLQEAVQTSILSKSWRYNWTTITQLYFGREFHEYITSTESLENIGFKNIINSVLHFYRGQALNFELILPYKFSDSSDFDKWMLFLSKKGVKELTLVSSIDYRSLSDAYPMKLPSHLYSCKDLRVLHLYGFVLEPQPPPASIRFKNLVAVSFHSVELTSDVFESIVSNALQLQILWVYDCKGVDNLNVHAPKLRKMHLWDDYSDYKTISLSNMPDLETAIFSFSRLDNYSENELSIESWPQLKDLMLRFNSLKLFASGKTTKLLRTKCYHLKCLTLSDIHFQAPGQFYYAVFLIKSSPNLQKLVISYPSYEEGVVEPITKFMEEQDWADCSLDQLQTVKMKMIYCGPELLLLKQLIRISPVLEEMSIEPSCIVDEGEASFIKQLRNSWTAHRQEP